LIVAVIALSDRSVDVVLPFKQRWFPHVLVAKNYQIEGLNCVSSDTEITQAQHQESLECLSTRAKTFVKHLEESATSELPWQPWDPGGIEIRRVTRSSLKLNFYRRVTASPVPGNQGGLGHDSSLRINVPNRKKSEKKIKTSKIKKKKISLPTSHHHHPVYYRGTIFFDEICILV
jgi:hypothetical protein